MRILLSTYSAAIRKSYGIVAKQIWERIVKADPSIQVVQHGWFHRDPREEVPWEIIPTRDPVATKNPDGSINDLSDIYGSRTLDEVIQKTSPGAIWALNDPWMCPEQAILKRKWHYKLMYYCPIDSEAYHPQWGDRIRASDSIIAFGEFGKGVIQGLPGCEHRHIDAIPHGVDTSLFQPVSSKERKREIRQALSDDEISDDKIVLGWVGKDQERKQSWALYAMMYYLKTGEYITCKKCGRVTVKEFDPTIRGPRASSKLTMYPKWYDYKSCSYCLSKDIQSGRPRDDIVLWAYMYNNPENYDLDHLAWIYDVQGYVKTPKGDQSHPGNPWEDVATFYQAMDIFVYPTGGEGFGLPELEALSSGLPTIYTNYSGHADFAIGEPISCSYYHERKTQRWRARPDLGDLIKSVNALIDDPSRRHQLGIAARKRARQYDWDNFTAKWLDVIYRTMRQPDSTVRGMAV